MLLCIIRRHYYVYDAERNASRKKFTLDHYFLTKFFLKLTCAIFPFPSQTTEQILQR